MKKIICDDEEIVLSSCCLRLAMKLKARRPGLYNGGVSLEELDIINRNSQS
jgi:hypothetical protein